MSVRAKDWVNSLAELDLEAIEEWIIEYKKGEENIVVDILSRRNISNDSVLLTAISFPTAIWLEKLNKGYLED